MNLVAAVNSIALSGVEILLIVAVIVAPMGFGFHHAARKRDYLHRERMKALEMGLPVPGDNAWSAAVCIAIGAVVPVGALIVALVATSLARSNDRELPPEMAVLVQTRSSGPETAIWTGSTLVGLAGVVGGSTLALRLFGSRQRSKHSDGFAKPVVDPDAYDVVGRRG